MQLADLIKKYDADVICATKTELALEDDFHLKGYTLHRSPISIGKIRQLTFVKTDIRHTGWTMNQSEGVPPTWGHVPEMDLIIGGCHRQWTRNC